MKMLKIPCSVGVLVLALLWPVFLAGQAPPAASDPGARIDKIFDQWNRPDSPGCAVAVGQGGRTVLARAYGLADLEHDVPNAPATIFEAGSVSKQFTAAAIVLLAQRGTLSLDDEVRTLVPEVPDYGPPIRIRHLLNHTSGLRDWGTVLEAAGWPRGTRIHTHDHVLDIVSRQKAINFPPGSEYLYCNTGYNLLAIIVERVSGQSFAEFTRQNLFVPLGMTRTQWRDDFTRIVKGRAVAYTRSGKEFRAQMPFENVHGNGGLLTTVGDLLLWNENFVDGRVGGRPLIDELQRRGRLTSGREIEYAAGLRVASHRGIPEVSHSGSTAGYRAFLALYLEPRVSVAVLCNVAQAGAPALAHQVADLFLGLAERASAEGTSPTVDLPPEVIASHAGLYRNLRTNEPMRLVAREGRLRIGSGPTLTPLSSSLFEVGSEGGRLTFDAVDAGRAATVRLLTADGDTVVFERVAEAAPTPAQLAEYQGQYHSDEAEATYTVVALDGKLVLHRRPAASYDLAPAYADAFTTRPGWLVRFTRDSAGRVEGLSLGLGRVRDLRFVRVRGVEPVHNP